MNTCLFSLFPRSVLLVLDLSLFWRELVVLVWGHRGGEAVQSVRVVHVTDRHYLGGLSSTPTSSSAQDSRAPPWLHRIHSLILRCAARLLTGLKAFNKVSKPRPDGEGKRAIQYCRTPQIHNQRAERRMRRVYLEDGKEGGVD